MKKNYFFSLIPALLSLVIYPVSSRAGDTTPEAQLAKWSGNAERAASISQGGVFFNTKHGGQWSCSSCHGDSALSHGKHASTGKSIKPLAPAGNPEAFTDVAKIDKWFRRNCKDVLSRECTVQEKADVLAYLLSLKL